VEADRYSDSGGVDVAQPAYKDEVLQVEPKGIEQVVEGERHGRPTSVFTLWIGANVEMATLVTGTLGVVVFGLSFWQAALAFVLGTVLGAALLGLLSTFGPRLGAPQLVISRRAFGFFGNFAPGILNIVAGIGWYAVNSVLGVFALAYLLGVPYWLGTVLMVVLQGLVAVYGHNLIHALERYLAVFLVLVFLAVSVYVAGHMNVGLAASAHGAGLSGGFLATVGVAFAYMAGWMAFASDYTRYLPSSMASGRVFGAAFLGNVIGAGWPGLLGVALASMAPKLVGNGTSTLTGPIGMVAQLLPHTLAVVLLVAVAVGTLTANVLNIYSAALSALVVNLPLRRWQAAVGIGLLGGLLTLLGRANFASNLESFLFVLAYWIAPWAAIIAIDQLVYAPRGDAHAQGLYDPRRGLGLGFVAWLVGVAASVPFFDQMFYTGPFAKSHPGWGDVSYWVSLVVASLVYIGLRALFASRESSAQRQARTA
jgi:NCS1 family nucleobase:cation symporter-1